MSSMFTDPLTSSLPRALAAEGRYRLRKVDGVLGIYLDYKNDMEFDGNTDKCSMLLRTVSHAEDFMTSVDDLEEELRCELAALRT